MTSATEFTTSHRPRLDGFVERALIDFALEEAFEARPAAERAACLHWISGAFCRDEEDSRVSELLDALDAGKPLPPGSAPAPMSEHVDAAGRGKGSDDERAKNQARR